MQEYANKHHISYEAVRKQVKRYGKELEGHITRQNRTQYLDDFAVGFLTEKRQQSPIIIVEKAKEEELAESKKQIESLKATIMELQSQLNTSKDRILELQEEKMGLIEERGKNQLLLEMKDKADRELSATRVQVAELEKQVNIYQTEVNSYHKTLFGLYRKV
jgi:chromosome segregation ATPase